MRYNGPVHEMGLALEIHRACRARLAPHGPARIDSVKVAVGELSAVEPEILRYAWEAVVADGPDAEATLEIEWHPARQVCDDCGEIRERVDGTWLRFCPRCEMPLRVEGGRQLDVVQFAFTPLLDVPRVEVEGADEDADDGADGAPAPPDGTTP